MCVVRMIHKVVETMNEGKKKKKQQKTKQNKKSKQKNNTLRIHRVALGLE